MPAVEFAYPRDELARIAEAALATAFGELLRSSGENAALALLDRMREKVISGEFEPLLRRH